MSAGKLSLVCKKTGERLPLEQLQRHGYSYIVVRVTTVKPYFLPFKEGTEPPESPHASAKPEEVDAHFDEINRRVIADCSGQNLPQSIRVSIPAFTEQAQLNSGSEKSSVQRTIEHD